MDGVVVHGAIDGNTRTITFIDVTSNNLAQTVFTSFMRVVAEYGAPSRIRCDGGGENNLVAALMEKNIQRL